jgi:toxin ParE1/3/4
MPNKYTKSQKADIDIAHITQRSFDDFGEKQTITYMGGLIESLQALANNPERGRAFIHSKTQQTYLFYRYVSHVIYYRQRSHDIFIVRILHTKMLPENHL